MEEERKKEMIDEQQKRHQKGKNFHFISIQFLSFQKAAVFLLLFDSESDIPTDMF